MKNLLPVFFCLSVSYGAQMYVGKDNTYNMATMSHTTSNATDKRPLNSLGMDGSFFWVGSDVGKYLPSGLPDNSFGGSQGYINVITNGILYPTQCYVSNTGLYVTTTSYLVYPQIPKIGKFNFNGVKDTTFAVNGVFAFPSNIKIPDRPELMINNDESIFLVVNDTSDGKNKVIKLKANGQIDNTFSFVIVTSGTKVLKASNNGFFTLYKPSSTVSEIYLKRYDAQGILDVTFGNQGTAIINGTNVNNFYINNLDEIFVLDNTSSVQSIQKFTPTGLLDMTFGMNGTFGVSTFNTGYTININNIDFDSSNHILLFGGNSTSTANSFIGRINSNGSLDNTFNNTSPYYTSSEIFAKNLSGKVLNDNEYMCISRSQSSSLVDYRSFKYIRKNTPFLAVQESNLNDKVNIYPNPVTDIVNINIKNEDIIKSKIYSLEGKLLKVVTKQKIDIDDLPTGNYIIEIICSNKIYRSKFIKK